MIAKLWFACSMLDLAAAAHASYAGSTPAAVFGVACSAYLWRCYRRESA